MLFRSQLHNTLYHSRLRKVAGAKAFHPKGLGRQHPTRVGWRAGRGFGGQDHGTRPRVQARYHLCAISMLAIAPEVDRINLGSNS